MIIVVTVISWLAQRGESRILARIGSAGRGRIRYSTHGWGTRIWNFEAHKAILSIGRWLVFIERQLMRNRSAKAIPEIIEPDGNFEAVKTIVAGNSYNTSTCQ